MEHIPLTYKVRSWADTILRADIKYTIVWAGDGPVRLVSHGAVDGGSTICRGGHKPHTAWRTNGRRSLLLTVNDLVVQVGIDRRTLFGTTAIFFRNLLRLVRPSLGRLQCLDGRGRRAG